PCHAVQPLLVRSQALEHNDDPYADHGIEVPALFIAGADDIVLRMVGEDAIASMRRRIPDLRGVVLVPGAGHFVQMEQAEATNAALLGFLGTLPR
ncbi:MAG: alpha/beta fold hydrolase, partial [Gammaproteobacteria bacterium]